MTAKEAIENLKAILEEATETEDAVSYVTSVDAESLNLAISALEKQDVPDTNVGDMISRQAAIDAVNKICDRCGEYKKYNGVMCGTCYLDGVADIIEDLPSAQPDGIPLEWINKHLEWLDNCDNEFAQLAKVSIRAMVELWKKDRI